MNTSNLVIGYILLFIGGFAGLHHLVTGRYGKIAWYVGLSFFTSLFFGKILSYITYGILSLMWFYDLFHLPSQIRSRSITRARGAARGTRRVNSVLTQQRRRSSSTTPQPDQVPPIITNAPPYNENPLSNRPSKKKKKKKSRFEIIDEEVKR